MNQWYYYDGEHNIGPFSLQDIKVAARRGLIAEQTWIASTGGPYQRAATVRDLAGLLSPGGETSPEAPTPPWTVEKATTVRVVKNADPTKQRFMIGGVIGGVLLLAIIWMSSGPTPSAPITIPTLDVAPSVTVVSPDGIATPPPIKTILPSGGAATSDYHTLFVTQSGVSIPIPDDRWIAAGMPLPSGFAYETWIPTGKGKPGPSWDPVDSRKAVIAIQGEDYDRYNASTTAYPDIATLFAHAVAKWGVPDYISMVHIPSITPDSKNTARVLVAFLWEQFSHNHTTVPIVEMNIGKANTIISVNIGHRTLSNERFTSEKSNDPSGISVFSRIDFRKRVNVSLP